MTSLATLLNGYTSNKISIDVELNGIASDSRQVQAGYLFIACRGTQKDGMRFIDDAVSRGAVAVAVDSEADISQLTLQVPLVTIENINDKLGYIAARYFQEPSKNLKLIGITGTNGKTSCSHLTAQCLDVGLNRCGIIGTMGNGFFNDLQTSVHTTPGAVNLQATLHQLYKHGAGYVAMEVSSHGLEQGRTNGCDFSIAVFTNLTRDHLDYHGTMEAYGAAKLRLFAVKTLRAAIVNLDDDFAVQVLNAVSKGVVTVGVSLKSDKRFTTEKFIRGTILQKSLAGTHVAIESSWGNAQISTPLLGEFNVNNLLLVLGIVLQLDVPFATAIRRLAALRAPKGRLESFVATDKPLVVVDYAHTPDALEKVLQTLQAHTSGQIWVVFGCGGDRDPGKRPLMGAIAEQYANHVWITDDNPRTELSHKIIADILAGIKSPERVVVLTPREKAIEKVIVTASANDIVLIAGKGHEDYQIIGDQALPFSDRDVVARMLEIAA